MIRRSSNTSKVILEYRSQGTHRLQRDRSLLLPEEATGPGLKLYFGKKYLVAVCDHRARLCCEVGDEAGDDAGEEITGFYLVKSVTQHESSRPRRVITKN